MIKTACGLDCGDACEINIDISKYPKLQADTNNGTLCSLLNKDIFETQRLDTPTINGKVATMEEALDATAEALKKNSLLWRGSGNFGVMQEITNLLFQQIGGSVTRGSLCDGAGDAGIVEGRGINRTLPLEQIDKAEVIIIWGKDISTTNSHLIPYFKDKKIVVVDPIETSLAKKADLFIQIKPRSDIYLILLLARFIFMENSEDIEWLDTFSTEHEEFYNFTKNFRIKAILEYLELSLNDIGDILNYIKADKVVILVGNGVQKYEIGHSILWAIDSLAATVGLFGREGCGVGYLGNSKLGFNNPFSVNCNSISKVNTPFNRFDTVLVQGGNPAESMPNSSEVINNLEQVENLIYFGLYKNETSKRASVVIPAKNFFEKDDVRLNYGDYKITKMNKAIDSDFGISEYEFTKELYNRLDFNELEDENFYIDIWLQQCDIIDGKYRSPAYQELPYSVGFGEDENDKFIFIDDFDDNFKSIKKSKANHKQNIDYWLITPKSKHAMNTQFKRENIVSLNPILGYINGQEIVISSQWGEYKFIVQNSLDIRDDCVVIKANAIGINYLTPSIISEEGENACYQEVKISIENIKE
ncbi:MAG: molybdopterin-dependent oxidoreductase [Sulfurovum sp.]|nr:molybdopterin-dependent oxidoreductase [Sulfurovaceae bacterium]